MTTAMARPFSVDSMCFVGANPKNFGGEYVPWNGRQAAYYNMPANWREVGLAEYIRTAAKIAAKQRGFAARQGLDPAVRAAALAAAEQNENVSDFGQAADINDIDLGRVGTYYGATVYRQVQPDPYRDSGAWEWSMKHAKQLESVHHWLSAAEAVAAQSPTARVSKGWGDYDLHPVA